MAGRHWPCSLYTVQHSLATVNGFEVTFAVPSSQADRLGETLRFSTRDAQRAGVTIN